MRGAVERFRAMARERCGLRYPEESRQLAREHARAVIAGGGTVGEAASQLGVVEATLERWLAGPGTTPTGWFHEVVVTAQRTRGDSVTLVSPSGWRIEGLSVDQLHGLLESLR